MGGGHGIAMQAAGGFDKKIIAGGAPGHFQGDVFAAGMLPDMGAGDNAGAAQTAGGGADEGGVGVRVRAAQAVMEMGHGQA